MNTTAMQFLRSELQELNAVVFEMESIADLRRVTSWLKPTKTYADIPVENSCSYQHVIENIIDRVYLVLNVVLMKLEECTGLQKVGVERPLRLTLSALSRIIMEKLSAFSRVRNARNARNIQRDIHMQTDFAEVGGCGSCVALFECFSNVENLFHDSITFPRLQNARSKVRSGLFILNNSQSMRIMCDAIHEDLRVFHDDHRALNESHAALRQQYDGLMDDFVNYTAECDAKFAQNEDALQTLSNTLHTWRDDFAGKLQSLLDSSARISATSLKMRHSLLEKQAEVDAILRLFAQHLEAFGAAQDKMAAKMASALDICTQRISALQAQLRHARTRLQPIASESQALSDDGNACVRHAGGDPVADMLRHIESNRSQIDYLRAENVALERTIARIRMLVT